jgi:TrmH family RNA methyltransferase
MTLGAPIITSLQNSGVKQCVKLRQRSHRDDLNLMLVEGYREILRAVANYHFPQQLYICRDLFQGSNEDALISRCLERNCDVLECSQPVFNKISYRDRPDGLLAVAPQIHNTLDDIKLSTTPFLVVAESIEKPGNLGTILRSADAAGADAVIVCDRCTDINNPNVVRASTGTIFSVKTVECTTDEALAYLSKNGITIASATPHSDDLYTNANMAQPLALILGAEQYGLSKTWLKHCDLQVKIPMLGQADSLNVASAATILIYEAVRQRNLPSVLSSPLTIPPIK